MLLFKQPKKVLITGGAGFLGSNLADRMLSIGYQVICVDNLFTGLKSNISHLINNPNFEFIRHDITHPLYLEVDEIYNLACPGSPPFYQLDPIQTSKTNFLGALNLLGLAKRCKAKIFQASTSEVYGDPSVHPPSEEYLGNVNPIGIRGCYDEGKRCAETLFFDYHRQHNVVIRVARIFNTYGPRMNPNDGRVVSNFIMQALQNRDITIYGDGQQTRSFCYVDDLVDGLYKLMHCNFDGKPPLPVNLGNPHEFTILDLAEKVISITGSSSKLVSMPLPQDDPRQRRPDISRAKSILDGWEPKVSLDEGLEKTILHFETLIKKVH